MAASVGVDQRSQIERGTARSLSALRAGSHDLLAIVENGCFVVVQELAVQGGISAITVVENWFEEFKDER